MPEIYVTMRSCSECYRNHADDGHGDDCDCWCHDGDMDLDDNGEPNGLDDWEW